MIDQTQFNSSNYLQIAFIDRTVEDYLTLLGGISPETEVILLESDRDGIQQITDALVTRNNISTIHVISHGSPGSLQLGNTPLTLENVAKYQSQLQQWNVGQILLYGCNVARGEVGQTFVQRLHDITGAELAASTTPTGNAELGGNWELDITIAHTPPLPTLPTLPTPWS